MKGLLNWEAIHKLTHDNLSKMNESDQKEMWGRSAEMYDFMAKLEKEHTQNQVSKMILDFNDTVVDIGCGPGRLTVPVAKRVKSVTAVDISTKMLDKCITNAKAEGLNNVVPLELNWMEKGAEKTVGMHDIAIASRSVGFSDIVKLNNIARKYVFVLSWANAPSLREIQLSFLEGITEDKVPSGASNRMFGYNVIFNLLYDMGIEPNVVIVEDGFSREYETKEQAYEDLHSIGEIPKDKEMQFRSNIDKYLTEKPAGGFLLLRKTKTFVMWWKPQVLDI
ncbi:MAG: class I SAM-dependent methyltransferase [Syntrophomonas sp.]|nr:class I SAM-dependent methyltransferase [Syntrophomonas sp.]